MDPLAVRAGERAGRLGRLALSFFEIIDQLKQYNQLKQNRTN